MGNTRLKLASLLPLYLLVPLGSPASSGIQESEKTRKEYWEEYRNEPLYEIADNFYIRESCTVPERRRKVLSELHSVPRKVKRAVLKLIDELDTLCAKAAANQISPSEWWKAYWEKKRQLDRSLDWCPNCLVEYIYPDELPGNFSAYAVFLYPTRSSQPEEYIQLLRIWSAFKSFGDSIGTRNAAVWFGDGSRVISVDIERSKDYCDRIGLDYNGGPYIVISNVRPDQLSRESRFVLIRLKDISPERAVYVLNLLEQDLRIGATPREGRLIYEEIKQRMMTLGERNADLVKEIFIAVTN